MSAGQIFSIVAQLDDFIVVDKLAPIDFHDDNGVSGLFSLVKNHLLSQIDLQSSQSDNDSENDSQVIYPVHRLDKLTTGLLIFAKNKQAASTFGALFEQHQIQKYYLAVSDHKPKKKQGWVKGDMTKSRRGSYKLLRSMDNPAITQFKSAPINDGKRLFLLKPHSGKTHQLRVALKSVAAPIIGDPLYHHKVTEVDRLYLHAWVLQFEFEKHVYSFKASSPQGKWFNSPGTVKQLDEWGAPWTQF